ncbi:MAG: hypothetical protein HY928_04740 [Elusimicrobia bacterium]|nr:hypothetical protein [Elusimicrobiota bacterium]
MAPSTEETPTRWDWWPLARLLTVLAVFGILAHARLGWTLDFRPLREFPRQVFEVFSLFTLLSFGLAHLYLVLLMLPLYALVTLNDTFYDATIWVARTVFRLRPGRVLSLAGLGGELLLFAAGAALIHRALH